MSLIVFFGKVPQYSYRASLHPGEWTTDGQRPIQRGEEGEGEGERAGGGGEEEDDDDDDGIYSYWPLTTKPGIICDRGDTLFQRRLYPQTVRYL